MPILSNGRQILHSKGNMAKSGQNDIGDSFEETICLAKAFIALWFSIFQSININVFLFFILIFLAFHSQTLVNSRGCIKFPAPVPLSVLNPVCHSYFSLNILVQLSIGGFQMYAGSHILVAIVFLPAVPHSYFLLKRGKVQVEVFFIARYTKADQSLKFVAPVLYCQFVFEHHIEESFVIIGLTRVMYSQLYHSQI